MNHKLDTVRVVNRHTEDFDVYIGRGTMWGNPFVSGIDGNRKEVIEKYREWVHTCYATSSEFRDNLRQLSGKALGCSCKPAACHGDVLVKLVRKALLEEG